MKTFKSILNKTGVGRLAGSASRHMTLDLGAVSLPLWVQSLVKNKQTKIKN